MINKIAAVSDNLQYDGTGTSHWWSWLWKQWSTVYLGRHTLQSLLMVGGKAFIYTCVPGEVDTLEPSSPVTTMPMPDLSALLLQFHKNHQACALEFHHPSLQSKKYHRMSRKQYLWESKDATNCNNLQVCGDSLVLLAFSPLPGPWGHEDPGLSGLCNRPHALSPSLRASYRGRLSAEGGAQCCCDPAKNEGSVFLLIRHSRGNDIYPS